MMEPAALLYVFNLSLFYFLCFRSDVYYCLRNLAMDNVRVARMFKRHNAKVSMYNKDGGNGMGATKMNIAWTGHFRATLH